MASHAICLQVLRYGVVVTPGTDEEGAGEAEGSGGAEERKRSEAAGPAQAGIRRMLVRVAPNKVQEMVTTQVGGRRAGQPTSMGMRGSGPPHSFTHCLVRLFFALPRSTASVPRGPRTRTRRPWSQRGRRQRAVGEW